MVFVFISLQTNNTSKQPATPPVLTSPVIPQMLSSPATPQVLTPPNQLIDTTINKNHQ